MSWLRTLTRPSIRNYTLYLCAFYLLMVFVFHSRLQFNGRSVTNDADQQAEYENQQGDANNAPAKDSLLKRRPTFKHYDKQESQDEAKLKPERRQTEGPLSLQKTEGPPIVPLVDHYVNKSINLFGKDRFANCRGPKAENEFVFHSANQNIRIFSGYWDTRPNDFDNQYGGVKIRLMAAIAGKKYRPSLKCFFDVNGKDQGTFVTYYEMCENHNKRWGGYILSCEVPPEIQNHTQCSVRVSLYVELNTNAVIATVPVYSIEPQEERYTFGMCVPPMFGNINAGKLIEFFELSFYLGAQHVMLYNFSIGAVASKTIQHYIDQGQVSVIPWNLPAVVDKAMWYHAQSIAIQDCLYRHMGISEFVIFNDVDEFLIPRPQMGNHWSKVIEQNNRDDVCGLKFKSAFFDPKHEPLKPLDSSVAHFPSLVTALNFRSKMLSRVRTKCMVKPRKIFEMGIHHISKPILADLQGVDVSANEAILHHYRSCLPGFGMNCREQVQDDTALRFGWRIYDKAVKAHAVIQYKDTIR